jgi:amino acid adenylation domain-containing protein
MNPQADGALSSGPQSTETHWPATALQAGMLFHAAAHPGTGVDVEQISITFDEPVDLNRLGDAWRAVTARQPVLSARFTTGADGSTVMALPSEPGVMLWPEPLDWTDLDDAAVEAAIAETRRSDRLTDFDLADGPIQRFTVARLSNDRCWMLWSFHHAVLDGRSFPLVLRELVTLYDGGPDQQLATAAPFTDYVEAVTAQDLTEAKRYWTSKLARFETAAAVPGPGSPEAPVAGPSVEFIERRLDPDQTATLQALADRFDVSLNTCVQAAWYLLLQHYSQLETITFGTTRACRHAVADSADMIGLLINTVPMALDADRSETVGDLLTRLRAEQTDLRAHETTPLPDIVECAPGGARGSAGGQLFESIVVFDDASLDARMGAAFPDHADTRHFRYDGQTNFPLTLLGYGDDSMLIRLEYAVDRYDADFGNQLFDHYLNLLNGLAVDPDRVAVTIPYLTEAEHARYDRWNDTGVDYELDTTLVAMFERQVAATPDAVALVSGSQTLTYDEFNRRANKLAHHLRANGVGPNVPVGVFAERSFEMMIAVYAIIKAGGGYMPLDPEHPEDRVQFMAEDSGVEFVLTQAHLVAGLPAGGDFKQIVLDEPHPPWADLPDTNPTGEKTAGPKDMAYLLYTSGSTGRPKGAIIEHEAIVNRLVWKQEAYGLDHTDCVLQKTPYTFDVSVWELFWPLQVGARLVMAAPGGHRDTAYLARTIDDNQVTTLHFVPSMLQLFVEEPTAGICTSVKRVICSGEALPRALQDRLFEILDCELHNLYGPTEAAIDVTWWACDADSTLDFIPIGYPISNTEVHVLDPDLQRVPLGVQGELHIGGVQLARGYHNRVELTAEKFIADPWVGDRQQQRPGDRLYKTGDLVRHMADGAVEFLGRIDHQVKIRGQRIELGEIESVISAHGDVRETVVVATGRDAADTRLVAYVVGNGLDEADLRSHCEVSLASYMVPSVWMFLDALPLNPNGKVDRKLLPAPVVATEARDIVDAGSETESAIVEIWQSLLGDDPIGVTETFFDVGGNSLLLIRLAQTLTGRFETNVTVPMLLRHSTVRQQAELVTDQGDRPDEAVAAGAAQAEARKARKAGRRRRNLG